MPPMSSKQQSAVVELDWSLPPGVRAVITDRVGGVSLPPFDSFNLASHVNDDIDCVSVNRDLLINQLKYCDRIQWLQQVHSSDVHRVGADNYQLMSPIIADASVTAMEGQACSVLTADCLPVLFCQQDGQQVAAAHAGWRGLAGGVLQQTLAQFADPAKVSVYIGPAIGPRQFQVGEDVLQAFQMQLGQNVRRYFIPQNIAATAIVGQRYLADLAGIAKYVLEQTGVSDIQQSGICSVENTDYFSYRRDGVTGRFASLIWIENRPCLKEI